MCQRLIVQHYNTGAVGKLERVMDHSCPIILLHPNDRRIKKRNKFFAFGSYPTGERAA
jgi:hypothetical protein